MLTVHPSQATAWLYEHYPTLLTSRQLQSLYETLIRGYWVPQTGLFLSFPGTSDLRLIQQSATYDEGIVGVLLVHLGDIDRARSLLKFYSQAWEETGKRSGPRKGHLGFANFYNGYYSVEGVEKTMHVGPNAWIGLFASRYYRKTHERFALNLALQVAHWIMDKVPHRDGAVAMGEIPWNSAPWPQIFSTENNISTYAFLSDLLKNEELPSAERRQISVERGNIYHWLVEKAYNSSTGYVMRGFNPQGLDTVNAVDSYTWYLSALKPSYLQSCGIPTDHLMRIAARDFTVQIGNRFGVDCVDPAMAEATYKDDTFVRKIDDQIFLRPPTDNHRLIWYEGQGQYIETLLVMADHSATEAFARPAGPERNQLLQQSQHWLERAALFTKHMDQASFPMPYGMVYPCATQGRFYLWGWPAPSPAPNHPSDAVAPLVWRMFSGMGFESLSDVSYDPRNEWHVKIMPMTHYRDPGTDLLYGASEEMVTQAWKLLEAKNYDRAIRQAAATIQLWKPDAIAMEKLKEKEVGGFLPYNGSVEELQHIHNYWALNDVAAAYFILGKIADEQGRYKEADQNFKMILGQLPLAQLWDKRGWFWSPITSIQTEYAEARSNQYGHLEALVPSFPLYIPPRTN